MAPEVVDRLRWSAEELTAHRRRQLRQLVRVALDRSPWHRQRLQGVDPEELDESSLAALPVMTKADLMSSFDDIVTDRRLSLRLAEAQLADDASGYLLGRYRAVSSGGSSGHRGVFVYDWAGWALYYLGIYRSALARPGPVANIAAGHPAHPTAAVGLTFSGPHLPILPFPVTLPLDRIVAGLNAAQPAVLKGYSSALFSLAHEAAAGRLQIQPGAVWAGSEPLFPEMRAALEGAWGVPVGNVWGTAEGGGLAAPCRFGSTHLNEDLAILEFSDEQGRPVPPGARAARVYLTSLINRALPLIRYELTDEVTLLPGRCACGSAHRRIEDIQGRLDDVFVYDGITVHPHVFRSPLGRCRNVLEYQVRQTITGATVDVCAQGSFDVDGLCSEMVSALRCVGIPQATVTVRVVPGLRRQETGKLRRFVPC